MTRILAFAGHKQAGKTTCSNFLHGYQLRSHGVIDGFDITIDGKLVIKTTEENSSETRGFLDVNRSDPEFAEWASYSMWPYIKNYSFARPLKEIAINLFNLSPNNIYGNNTLKETKTNYLWEKMPGVITDKTLLNKKDIKLLIESGVLQYHESGYMSHREFLQYLGTDVCRKIYSDIWYSRLINDIAYEQPLVAIVDDCRFINEAESIKNASGKVIYLTRNPYDDNHISESQLENYEGFDLVIDNQNLSIHETNVKIMEALNSWGWLGQEIMRQPKTPQNQPQIVGGIHRIKK